MKVFTIPALAAGLVVGVLSQATAQTQPQAAPMQNMPGMDHSNMPGMGNMSAMGHSNMPGMQPAPAQGARTTAPAKPTRPATAPSQPRTN